MYKWGWSKNEECVIEPDLDHAVPKPLPPDFLVISNIMCIFPAVVNSSVAQHQDLFVVLVWSGFLDEVMIVTVLCNTNDQFICHFVSVETVCTVPRKVE